MPPLFPSDRADRRAFVLILLLAAVLRLLLVPATLTFHHPDELWQYIEPAYGLVTGRWIQTWEYRFGIRSWLVPLLLAAPEGIGHALAPRSDLHLLLVRLATGVCSLLLPWAFFGLGRRIGRAHAWIAGMAGASWVEIVYFADRPLSDAIALWLVAPALLMAARLRDGDRRAGVAAGALLSLAFAVRFQLAPALGLFALWGSGLRWQAGWAPVLLGAAFGLGIDALADLAMGQVPFLWIVRNVTMNLFQSRAATYGVEPFWWYLAEIWRTWKLLLLLLLPLALAGARRYPAFLLASVVLIAFHSLIAHKEYRFILLATTLLVLLAAIGTGDGVERLARGRPPREGMRLIAIACLMWLGVSMAVGLGTLLRDGRVPEGRGSLLVRAGQVPGLCGIGIDRLTVAPSVAEALINRPGAPPYLFDGPSAEANMLGHRAAFDAVIARRGEAGRLGSGYRISTCTQIRPEDPAPTCLFVRAGGCDARGAEAFGYNAVLRARGD